MSTPSATSAAPSINGSVTDDDIIDISSSDVDPFPEDPPASSPSPLTVTDDENKKGEAMEKEFMDGEAAKSGEWVALYELTPLNRSSEAGSQAGGSRDVPILVADSSPTASPVVKSKPPPKAIYSIFAPRKPAEDAASSSRYGKPSAKATSLAAPFPDDANQHVRGPQVGAHVTLSLFPRRVRRRTSQVIPESPPMGSRSVYRSIPPSSRSQTPIPMPLDTLEASDLFTRKHCLSSLPMRHRSYPAISRVVETPLSFPPSDEGVSASASLMWNDKWRPRRADEVLGNEQSALYLRDWLLTLKLHLHKAAIEPTLGPATSSQETKQKIAKPEKRKGPRGTKRPRVVRDVERKRRRKESEEPEEAWSAVDFSDEDDPLDIMDIPEDDFGLPHLSRLKRASVDDPSNDFDPSEETEAVLVPPCSDGVPLFSYKAPKFGDTVCNTILLTGPSGCGKTASVYACAEELGWDVFEVYPGIGERNGSALQKLIGEVGKNHLVRKAQHPPKPEQGKAKSRAKIKFFAKRIMTDDEEEPPTALEPVPEAADPEPQGNGVGEVSQSIVLVEEVDVLFRQDTNFWPTMIKIIKECKRPVVLTCTGRAHEIYIMSRFPDVYFRREFSAAAGPTITNYPQLETLPHSTCGVLPPCCVGVREPVGRCADNGRAISGSWKSSCIA